MSCRSPARRSCRRVCAFRPICSAIATAISATRSEWRWVYGDFASITCANASAIRSRSCSSAVSTWSLGSRDETSSLVSPAQNARSRATASNASTSAGSNQRPLPLPGHRQRARPPAVGDEHLDRLREARDPSEQRDLLAAQPVGIAATVPVLVEGADRSRSLPGSRACGRSRRRARSGSRRAAPGSRAAAADERADERRTRRDHGRGRPSGGRRPPSRAALEVDALQSVLRRVILGAEERVDARRVRRAAGVLEQERVEERRAPVGVEPDLLGDPHADQARAHRMTARLPLGQVEGVRKRRDNLGEP